MPHDTIDNLYGVSTKALNQAVKRKADKFPGDFMFQLISTEAEELQGSRSQFVTLKRGQNIKYLPNALASGVRTECAGWHRRW